ASARVFHALRQQSPARKFHSGWLSRRAARCRAAGRAALFAQGKSRHRLPQARSFRKGGRVMATRMAEVATGVPALAPERPVIWPKRTRSRLANGLEIIFVESHTIPKFHGELFFRSGNAAIPNAVPGLADLTANVVRTGTANYTSRQLEET